MKIINKISILFVLFLIAFSACKSGTSVEKQLEDIYFLERTKPGSDSLLQVYQSFIKNNPSLDTAEHMYLKMATIYFEQQNNMNVINILKDCIRATKLPAVREQALRMYALVNDKEGNTEVAKSAYLNYLKEFPNHGNSQNMRDALKFVGLTPEEIMKTWADSSQTQ